MADVTGARELMAAAAREAHALAEQTSGALRKRLQVLAHVAELAERELAHSAEAAPGNGQLAEAIRAGKHDGDLPSLAARLRPTVRGRLAVVRPGYDGSPGPP